MGFEPTTSSLEGPRVIDWEGFEKAIKAKEYRGGYGSYMLNLCMQYSHCLLTGNYSELQQLPHSKTPNLLRSLSALSKFLGMHEEFKKGIKQYGLTWVSRSNDDLIIDRLNRSDDPEDVWNWCRDVKDCFPELSDFMDLIAVTGLRFSEALNAYNLIIQFTKEGTLATKYYNPATGFLEHFRFKEIFIRCSKKAYISYVPLELLESIGAKTPMPIRNPIQKHFQRRHIPQRFADVREANGTFLLKYLNETEIDVLAGRIGTSVFRVHYLNVKMIADLRQRAAKAAQEILQKITVDSLVSTKEEVNHG